MKNRGNQHTPTSGCSISSQSVFATPTAHVTRVATSLSFTVVVTETETSARKHEKSYHSTAGAVAAPHVAAPREPRPLVQIFASRAVPSVEPGTERKKSSGLSAPRERTRETVQNPGLPAAAGHARRPALASQKKRSTTRDTTTISVSGWIHTYYKPTLQQIGHHRIQKHRRHSRLVFLDP
jgi:hypothetical protein